MSAATNLPTPDFTFDPNAPNAPGAPEELRISVRSWLAARLLPHNANLKRKET